MDKEDNLNSIRGAVDQINEEIESIKQHVYVSEDSLVRRMAKIETRQEATDKMITVLEIKYKTFKAEDRKGQWGLFILLLSTLLGWISQLVSWYLTP